MIHILKRKLLILGLFLIFIQSNCKPTQKYEGFEHEKRFRSLKKALNNKEEVHILDLSNKKLDGFPEEILQLKNLKILNLSYNNISEIPSEIYRLENLEVLVLMEGNLHKLPDEIGSLKKLRIVNLMRNELSDLPKTMVNMSSLKRLLLAYNNLTDENALFLKKAFPKSYILVDIIL